MNKLFAFLVCTLFSFELYSQSLIILDEGYNTQQRLDIPDIQRGNQRCSSVETRFEKTGSNYTLESGSLCTDQNKSKDYGVDVANYRNKKLYTTGSPTGQNFSVRVRAEFNGSERGEHGNWVSNAAHDFENSLTHELWQVFGIKRDGSSYEWVTALDDDLTTIPGETVVLALDELGLFNQQSLSSSGTVFDDSVGAVVLSLDAGSGGVSDLRCGSDDGQISVNILRQRGIAVVVALPNDDIPSNSESWPACIDGVINVGGESASQSTGNRQIGVGENGIDFFAKDTTNDSQEGNSFAAPRVAAAYALLHKRFPYSSVEQKTNALIQADTLTDTYRTRLVNGQFRTYRRRKIRESHIPAAIDYLSVLFPPPFRSSSELNIVDSGSFGPLFGAARVNYSLSFDFRAFDASIKREDTSSLTQVNNVSVLSTPSRRDVELEFTGSFGAGSDSREFSLSLNGQVIKTFTGFSQNSASTRSFIINRNDFLSDGENTLTIAASDLDSNWGVQDVSLRYLPEIELQVGEKDTKVYGYEQTPNRYTGLRMSFQLLGSPDSALILKATGYDIDRDDETSVFVNDQFLGFLPKGDDSEFSASNEFAIEPSKLKSGKNTIEFVQREPQVGVWGGIDDEIWGVKDVAVMTEDDAALSYIVTIIYFILDVDDDVEQ